MTNCDVSRKKLYTLGALIVSEGSIFVNYFVYEWYIIIKFRFLQIIAYITLYKGPELMDHYSQPLIISK